MRVAAKKVILSTVKLIKSSERGLQKAYTAQTKTFKEFRMIEFINVSLSYPNGYNALRKVSFSINEGELVLLFGPSGAGKTSIFNLLLGLASPSCGKIQINRQTIQQQHLRQHVSMVFQTPQLLPNETIFDNVALPLVVNGYRQAVIKERTVAALKKAGLLAKASLHATDVSSGEKKLAEIARAIVTVPKILLVDEPSSNVDAATAVKILNLFKAFNQVGMTLLIATHHHDLFKNTPVKSMTLRDGQLENPVTYA